MLILSCLCKKWVQKCQSYTIFYFFAFCCHGNRKITFLYAKNVSAQRWLTNVDNKQFLQEKYAIYYPFFFCFLLPWQPWSYIVMQKCQCRMIIIDVNDKLFMQNNAIFTFYFLLSVAMATIKLFFPGKNVSAQ